MQTVHATSVAIDGNAVLIRGPSGGGKSDLALRLIDAGAQLIADDRTGIGVSGGRLFAHAPDPIAGLIEVRGLGIVRLPYCAHAPVALVVDLQPSGAAIERLPPPAQALLLGIAVVKLDLHPFEASAGAKVRLAVRAATRDSMILS